MNADDKLKILASDPLARKLELRNAIDELLYKNQKMREVLEQYAQRGISFNNADWDVGEDARDVLKQLYGMEYHWRGMMGWEEKKEANK